MTRLLGINLPNKKPIYIGLTYLYGVGIATSKRILNELQIDPKIKVTDLTEENISSIRDRLESGDLQLEGDLRRIRNLNIKRLIEINSLRGRRHLKGLPVRGQRTRTNSRTSRRQNKYVRKG